MKVFTQEQNEEEEVPPLTEGSDKCSNDPNCKRPCHKKFLKDHQCSDKPQPHYDPANFSNVNYNFWDVDYFLPDFYSTFQW